MAIVGWLVSAALAVAAVAVLASFGFVRDFVPIGLALTTTALGTLLLPIFRWSIVLLIVLLSLAAHFGLDVVLGAVLAGVVLRRWTRQTEVDADALENKLEAVGYGVFIPLFVVSSGMSLDIRSIAANPLRLIVFAVLLLVVRGLPSLLIYAPVLPFRERLEMTFIAATTMPLLIALAAIGLSDGVMLPSNAAALVGAGVVSVLVYPAIATTLHRTAVRSAPR